MANGTGITTNVTWHVGDQDNKCHNGEGKNDRPCLFPPTANGDPKKNQTVQGTISVKENVPVDNFLIDAWLATSSPQACNVTLILGDRSVTAELGNYTSPNNAACTVLDRDLKPCTSENWFPFNTTVPAGASYDLSISWDDAQASLIFDNIVGRPPGSVPPTSPPTTGVAQTAPGEGTSSSSSSTALSSISTNIPTESAVPTPLPPSRSQTSPPVDPGASVTSTPRHRHSKARTIAPAVIVPIVLVLAAVVGYYLWRQRRRLARVAPSARFKGESPEMKPWLPLDAQRSVSRQD